jgi:hypothetical protein
VDEEQRNGGVERKKSSPTTTITVYNAEVNLIKEKRMVKNGRSNSTGQT